MRAPWTLFCVAAVVLAAIEPPPAAAQSRELQRRLAAATRVECTFTMRAKGDWNGAEAHAAVEPAEHEATFFDIDVDSGTAEAGSAYGNSFISVRYSSGYLHFMQISDVGPLFVTTVLAHETANGRLKAVQTRVEYAATTLPGFATRPEIYFGDCAVTT